MTGAFFIFGIGAIVVQSAILYLIISYATKADRRARYDWAQTQFLAHIAKQHGMPAEEIQRIMDELG